MFAYVPILPAHAGTRRNGNPTASDETGSFVSAPLPFSFACFEPYTQLPYMYRAGPCGVSVHVLCSVTSRCTSKVTSRRNAITGHFICSNRYNVQLRRGTRFVIKV
jgi:hypothetical protein